MSQSLIFIKQNDLAPDVEAQLIEPKKPNQPREPIDLTAAVAVRFLASNGVNAPCTVDDELEGRVRYVWQAGDTDVAGTFEAEFEIEWAGGKKQTVPSNGSIKLIIDEDLG